MNKNMPTLFQKSQIIRQSQRKRRRMRSVLLPLFLLILLFPLISVSARHERTIDGWRPINYNVALTLDDRLTEITKARAEVTVEILREGLTKVDLDFGELVIDAVAVGGNSAKFDRPPGLLNVELPSPGKKGARVIIAVEYHGQPTDGLIFASDKDGKPSATGDNWPNRVPNLVPS